MAGGMGEHNTGEAMDMLHDEEEMYAEDAQVQRERGLLKVATNTEVIDVPPLIEAVVEMKRKLDLLHNRLHELKLACPMAGDCYKLAQAPDSRDAEIAVLRAYIQQMGQQQTGLQYPQATQQIYPQGPWTTTSIPMTGVTQTVTTPTPAWYQQLLGQTKAK